jgi:tetratricopeptide (TPR) repeat protein
MKDAETEFKLAIALSPDYATAHQWYAGYLTAMNRKDAAFEQMKTALALDPRSVSINADMCQMSYFLYRYDEALAQCSRTLELNPASAIAMSNMYEIYTISGRYAEAVETYVKLEGSKPSSMRSELDDLRQAFAHGGMHAFWRRKVDAMLQTGLNRYEIARYYARLGDDEKAIASLEEAILNRDFDSIFFAADPTFARFIGRNVRFEKLTKSFLDR